MADQYAYLFQFGLLERYWPALLRGFGKTLQISGWACLVCLAIVVVILSLRMMVPARNRTRLNGAINVYIDLVQALPVLVALVWVYFGLPLIGLRLSPDFASVLVLGVSFSAFALDLYLGAEASIPREQIHIAKLHGVAASTIAVRILLPKIGSTISDPLVGQIITLIKLSTFASIIGSQEILSVANGVISTTYRPLEVYSLVALVFILAIVPVNLLRRAAKHREITRNEIA